MTKQGWQLQVDILSYIMKDVWTSTHSCHLCSIISTTSPRSRLALATKAVATKRQCPERQCPDFREREIDTDWFVHLVLFCKLLQRSSQPYFCNRSASLLQWQHVCIEHTGYVLYRALVIHASHWCMMKHNSCYQYSTGSKSPSIVLQSLHYHLWHSHAHFSTRC